MKSYSSWRWSRQRQAIYVLLMASSMIYTTLETVLLSYYHWSCSLQSRPLVKSSVSFDKELRPKTSQTKWQTTHIDRRFQIQQSHLLSQFQPRDCERQSTSASWHSCHLDWPIRLQFHLLNLAHICYCHFSSCLMADLNSLQPMQMSLATPITLKDSSLSSAWRLQTALPLYPKKKNFSRSSKE